VAGTAHARAVEIGAAGLSIAGNDIQSSARIAIARNGLHTLVKKMRKVDNLRIGELCLMRGLLLSGGADAVSKTVSQDDSGTDQIRATIGSLRGASMAVDAVLGVDKTSAVGGSVIDALSLCRARLWDGKQSKKQRNQETVHGPHSSAKAAIGWCLMKV
jgi:hypothetical protein